MSGMISHQAALIYTMVLVSAADQDMTNAELNMMGGLIRILPAFEGYDPDHLPRTAGTCADLLSRDDGMENVFSLIEAALPPKLCETAYALACDIAAADGEVHQEELRMLELVRHRLEVDRLTAAAIERGARARFARA